MQCIIYTYCNHIHYTTYIKSTFYRECGCYAASQHAESRNLLCTVNVGVMRVPTNYAESLYTDTGGSPQRAPCMKIKVNVAILTYYNYYSFLVMQDTLIMQ